jgi:hypothetical protein
MKEKIGRADITIHVEPCPYEVCPGRHKCPGDYPLIKDTNTTPEQTDRS